MAASNEAIKAGHRTLVEGVRGYIDAFAVVVDGSKKLRGWYFHETAGCCKLSIEAYDKDGNLLRAYVPSVEPRKDVAEFYENNELLGCGFNALIDGIDSRYYRYDIIMLSESFGRIKVNEIFEKLSSGSVAELPSPGMTPITAPSFVVVDNFYTDPDSVRRFALSQEFKEHPSYHKGRRTDAVFKFAGLKEQFERILGTKIANWDKYGTNGCFQYCIAGDQLVYHQDTQEYAGVLFLTPDAPPETGTQFFRSKATKKMSAPWRTPEFDMVFKGGFLDRTAFDEVDTVGNVYNRLVLFNSHMIHAATEYFGQTKETGRLFQLFFFDLETPATATAIVPAPAPAA